MTFIFNETILISNRDKNKEKVALLSKFILSGR